MAALYYDLGGGKLKVSIEILRKNSYLCLEKQIQLDYGNEKNTLRNQRFSITRER